MCDRNYTDFSRSSGVWFQALKLVLRAFLHEVCHLQLPTPVSAHLLAVFILIGCPLSKIQLRQSCLFIAMSDLSKWLNKFGNWNTKRTKTTCSIFSIPNELLCEVISDSVTSPVVEKESQPHTISTEDRGRTCRACNLTFLEQSEQQLHFKCELHRINLKRSLAGLEPLESLSGANTDSTGTGRVHFAEEADQSSSDDDDDDEDLIYSADNDLDTEIYEDVESEGLNLPRVYTTEEGVARKYSSKQDGPQYLFSPRKDALWDISVSVGALHDSVNINQYEVEPWTLLSKAVQKIQGNCSIKWQILIGMMHC